MGGHPSKTTQFGDFVMYSTSVHQGRRSAPLARTLASVVLSGLLGAPAAAQTANDWLPEEGDFCNANNWSLGVVPNTSHHAYLGRFGAPYPYVEMHCPVSMHSLTVQNGAWLFNENQQLFVQNQTTVDGLVTWITVSELPNPNLPAFYTHNLTLTNNGGVIMLENSRMNVYDTLTINNGELRGTGTVNIIDGSNRPAFILNGWLAARDGHLAINLNDDARFKLGGNPNNNIRAEQFGSNLTLNGKVTPNDPFNGFMGIMRGNTITMTDALQISGLMRMSMGFLEQPSRFSGAGIEFLNGGRLWLEDGVGSIQGTYAKWSNGSTLDVDPVTIMSIGASEFALIDSTATVNGYLQVFGDSHYQSSAVNGSGILRQSGDAEIYGNVVINMPGGTFDMDGSSESTAITVNANSHLSVTAGAIDYNAPNRFDGTLVNRGLLTVNTPQPWTLGGELTFENDIALADARLQGSPLILASGSTLRSMPGGADLDLQLTVHDGAIIEGTGPGVVRLLQPSTWYGGVVNGTKELRPHGDMLFDGGTTEINIDKFAWDNANTVITSNAHLIVRSPEVAVDSTLGYQGNLTVQGHLTLDRGTLWNFAGTMHLTSGTIDGDELRFWNGNKIFVHGLNQPSQINAPIWLYGSERVQADPGTILKLNGPTILNGASINTPLITGLGTIVQNGDLLVKWNTFVDVASYDLDGDQDAPSNCVIEPNATLRVAAGSISNADNSYRGNMTIYEGGTFDLALSSGLWNMDGALTLHSAEDAEMYAAVTGSAAYMNGRVEGAGKFVNMPVAQIGTFAPGSPATEGTIALFGRLMFQDGYLTQSWNSNTEIKIGGSTPGISHDQLVAYGNNAHIIANGALNVELANGFVPSVGQSFVIVEAPFILGEYSTVNAPGFEITYENNPAPMADRVLATYTGTGCPGDIAPAGGDGIVDGADLLTLLSQWGVCPDEEPCSGDLNGDGVVDGADLLTLLSNWGPCL
jgi:hypothetical protein